MCRTDRTGFGDIKVIQRNDFGYGVDAVLLAAFAAGETGAAAAYPSSKDEDGRSFVRAADLGTDCGIVAFIYAHKVAGSKVLGVEKREEAADRARRAVDLNGMEDRISIITSDVADIADGDSFEEAGTFDAVLSNPPYFRKDAAIPSTSADRYTARHETTAGIGEFAKAASLMLKRGGRFYLVHRPERLTDIFVSLRAAGLEPKELQLVSPREGEAANIALISAVKGGGPGLKMLCGLAVHTADNGYTQEILRIYERQ